MISEEQIEALTERLVKRIDEANTYYLKKLGASVGKIKELTPEQAQQLAQILKYGGTYDDIVEEISKYTNRNVADIDEIFSAYAKIDQQFYDKFYKHRNIEPIPYEEDLVLKRQTTALSNETQIEMYSLSRTNVLGYSVTDPITGKKSVLGLDETFNRVLDEAVSNISQGKETYDSAMTRIMKEVGESGLKTVDFESGRSIRLDSAIRSYLRGQLRQLHNNNQEIIGERIGADGVEISVHFPCAEDHLDVQGKQYSTVAEPGMASEFDKLQATLDRPIGEYNCRHFIFSVIMGVNEPDYSKKQLEQIKKDNNKGFDFDGKHYTTYQGTQLQRNLERKIREQKDVQIFAKAGNNTSLVQQAQQKITQLTRKYKELSEVSGLPTKAQRLKVTGYKRTK